MKSGICRSEQYTCKKWWPRYSSDFVLPHVPNIMTQQDKFGPCGQEFDIYVLDLLLLHTLGSNGKILLIFSRRT